MNRFVLFLVVLLTCVGTLFPAAQAEESGDAESVEPVELKVATVDAIGTLRNRMGDWAVDYLADIDNGALSLTHIEGPVLGTAGQVMDQVAEGSVAIIGTDMAWIAPYDKDLLPTSFGFVFRDLDHFLAYFNSDVFGEIVDRIAEDQGLRIVAATPLTTRMFFSREPINTVDDLRGLKIRAPGLEMFVESYKAYGANPTPIAWNETFLALKTGVVDAGQGLPVDVLPNRWHEAAPHVTQLNDMYAAHAWVINEDIWQSLSAKQQEALTDTLTGSNEWALDQALSQEANIIAELESEGAIFNDDFRDTMKVREMALAHAKKLEAQGKWSAGLIDRMNAIE